MTEKLTSALKSQLKTRGRSLSAAVQIGKNGITEAIVEKITQMFENQELIKLKVLNAAPFTAKMAADEIAEAAKAELVGVTGSTILLYRASQE